MKELPPGPLRVTTVLLPPMDLQGWVATDHTPNPLAPQMGRLKPAEGKGLT